MKRNVVFKITVIQHTDYLKNKLDTDMIVIYIGHLLEYAKELY